MNAAIILKRTISSIATISHYSCGTQLCCTFEAGLVLLFAADFHTERSVGFARE